MSNIVSKDEELPVVDYRSKNGKPLSDKEEAFLSYLVGPAKGDVDKAFKMAGFTLDKSSKSFRHLIRKLSDEIVKDVHAFMTVYGLEALNSLISVLRDPSQPGANNIIHAANSVLDRAGITKKDRIEVEHTVKSFAVILPEKSIPLSRPILDVTADNVQ